MPEVTRIVSPGRDCVNRVLQRGPRRPRCSRIVVAARRCYVIRRRRTRGHKQSEQTTESQHGTSSNLRVRLNFKQEVPEQRYYGPRCNCSRDYLCWNSGCSRSSARAAGCAETAAGIVVCSPARCCPPCFWPPRHNWMLSASLSGAHLGLCLLARQFAPTLRAIPLRQPGSTSS